MINYGTPTFSIAMDQFTLNDLMRDAMSKPKGTGKKYNWNKHGKYTPEKIRELNAVNGVGKRKR